MEKDKQLPSKEGLEKAIERLKRLRKKPPTDELIQIISELPEPFEDQEDESRDRAAKKSDQGLDL